MSKNDMAIAPHGEPHYYLKKRRDLLLFLFIAVAFLSAAAAAFAFAVVLGSSLTHIQLASLIPNISSIPSNREIYMGILGLLLIMLIFLMLARLKFKSNIAYQYTNGCPNCRQQDLVRVHRSHFKRVLAKILLIPLRSYACRGCRWRGGLLYYPLGRIELETDDQEFLEISNPINEGFSKDQDSDPITESDDSFDDAFLNMMVDSEETGFQEKIVDEVPTDEIDQGSHIAEEFDQVSIDAQDEIIAVDPSPLGEITIIEEGLEVDLQLQEEPESTEVFEEPIEEPIVESISQREPLEEEELVETQPVGTKEYQSKNIGFALADPPLPKQSSGDGSEVVGRAIVVAPFGLSMRSEPDKSAEIILSLEPDTIVDVLNLEDSKAPVNWRQVSYKGQVGWVSAAFLKVLQS